MKKQNLEYEEQKASDKNIKRKKKKQPRMKVSGQSVKGLAKILKHKQ